MSRVIILFSLICVIFFTGLFILERIKSRDIRNQFIVFLEDKSDIETLIEIGEYNIYGKKERRRVLDPITCLLEKYEKTQIEDYINYANSAIKSARAQILFGFFAFVGLCVFSVFITPEG